MPVDVVQVQVRQSAILEGLTAVTVITEASCGNTNGSIDLTVSGGTGGYTYNWDTGATPEDLTGVAAGVYVVTITDSSGCETVVSTTVTQPADIVLLKLIPMLLVPAALTVVWT